ncbi:hypothetical protein MAR_020117 [Mya arenaria]|uniref:Uncharacterized protein n=1 Tax=Mya arenaria TaxID=6604 RepID=A0ABY7E7L5_MYAAR|nr:hypothetical protein MAR_020117 [Mya arenaria]
MQKTTGNNAIYTVLLEDCHFVVDLPVSRLNLYQTPDGSNFEPTTLRGFLGSFERYLRDQNNGYSSIHGPEFAKLKEVFQAKQLKGEGLGNKPKSAVPITDEEIRQLWETKQLGKESSESIVNSLVFLTL